MKKPALNAPIILTLVVLTALAIPTSAQTPTNKISAKEALEARKIASQFSQRLQRTKDIAPLLDEFVVDDFLNGYLQDEDQNWFFLLQRNAATQISRVELREYFIAELNWLYLSNLYVFSKYSSLSGLDMPPEKVYPSDVLNLLLSDPFLKATIENKNSDDSVIMISSVDRFRDFLPKLQKASVLLRKHARRINAGHTPQYRETISDWSDRYHHYQPWVTVCDQGCLGMPKGTRLILINVPSLQLQLAEVRGHMRIVSATYYMD